MESRYLRKTFLPTQSLPRLVKLDNISALTIKNALDNLRILYLPHTLSASARISNKISVRASIALRSSTIKPIPLKRRQAEEITLIPDSGYASAEEDDDSAVLEDDIDEGALSIPHLDPFERGYALKWLTGFVCRSDDWLLCSKEEDETLRAELLEEAAKLITSFSDDTPSPNCNHEEDGSIVRPFSFSTPLPGHGVALAMTEITVQLNDAPLSNSDHTSVGLQSWGSSIILAERICSAPFTFSILGGCDDGSVPPYGGHPNTPLRVLELGAGTGLLGITICKLAQLHSSPTEVVATDYHPDVLANLSSNIATNFQLRCPRSKPSDIHPHPTPISVHAFDWEHPDYSSTPFHERFDVILAADVVYHPLHATWIKNCVERLLLEPGQGNGNGGVFWLMIPVRTTGRHEEMHSTVEEVFRTTTRDDDLGLGILETEKIPKRNGIGRADESGYKLYKIGWHSDSVIARPQLI